MKTYIKKMTLTREHIDTERNHVGMSGQSDIIVEVITEFMATLNLGLKDLKEREGCYFMVYKIKDMTFFNQLFLNDVIEIEILMGVSGRCSLGLDITFSKEGKVATEATLTMNLVQTKVGESKTSKPMRIPTSITEVIGPKETGPPPL